MAGIHGKNAVLRVSSSETILSGASLTALDSTGKWQAASGSRDWKYDRERTLITYWDSDNGGIQARLDTQTRLINYAGGAVFGNSLPMGVASGLFAQAISMQLTTVAELIGDARSFTVNMSSDTVDTTTIGESWKTFEDGLAGFEGSLDGLYIDDYWYKKATTALSGLIPQNVLRFSLNPRDRTDYYQGTVIFPNWEVTGGYDAVIEHSVEFQGRGPLDLIQDGEPFFKIHETTM